MRPMAVLVLALGLGGLNTVWGYVEAPYTLGQVITESSHVVLVEVSRVNKDKNLIVYKKVQDLKGKHPGDEIKHNIGKRGFHEREWKSIMAWAEVGKKAVFFHNGGASETCIGDYWYQCYAEGEWWGLSHAEPFLLRTYCGDADKLSAAVANILKGQEVVISCMADANKEQLHQRKGKLQRMKASLKRLNYNAKRDFVAFGGDGDDIVEFKTVVLLEESSPGWRFLPLAQVKPASDQRWRMPDFDDRAWRTGKAPIGYGEEEIGKRKGTAIAEQGQPVVFRRIVEVPANLLTEKGVIFRLALASDDNAVVYVNGEVVDADPEPDHEFSYWNRDVELPAKRFKAGRNVIAVLVGNKAGSSDLYLDLELSAQIPVPKTPAKK